MPGSPPLIRLATAADVEEILRQRCQMFHDLGRGDETSFETMQLSSREPLAEALASGRYIGFLAMRGGEVIGGGGILQQWVFSAPETPRQFTRPYVLNVYTYPESRRAGVATALMRAMMAWAKEQGHEFLWLHASPQGRPVYEQLGFKVTNEMKLKLQD